MKPKLKGYFALFFLLCCIGMIAQQKIKQQPNIIIILSDDAGYADFSFQSDRLIPTPNIDRIANEGVKFTNAYVTGAVCAPSRAGMLTGINQACFGNVYNFIKNRKYNIKETEYGIPENIKLVGEYLGPLGYKSGIVGKWHEGFSGPFLPNKRGFDYFWGFLWGSSKYFSGQANEVQENGKPVPADSIPYMTDAIADKAQAFIESNKNNPFFLYVSFNAVHVPQEAKSKDMDKFKGKFDDKIRVLNAAMTNSLDENVGKILDKLEKLNLADNTIVIFTNDNGGEKSHIHADNFPLRGMKSDAYEGGIRVPMAIRWKGQIKPNSVCNRIVSTLDFVPTFIDVAGGNYRKNQQLQGQNIMDILSVSDKTVDNRTLYWCLTKDKGAIRSGDWKLVCLPNKTPELYNLKNDIGEEKNVYSTHLDKANELFSSYKKWKASLPPLTYYPIGAEASE